jgi:hypothetical protein
MATTQAGTRTCSASCIAAIQKKVSVPCGAPRRRPWRRNLGSIAAELQAGCLHFLLIGHASALTELVCLQTWRRIRWHIVYRPQDRPGCVHSLEISQVTRWPDGHRSEPIACAGTVIET